MGVKIVTQNKSKAEVVTENGNVIVIIINNSPLMRHRYMLATLLRAVQPWFPLNPCKDYEGLPLWRSRFFEVAAVIVLCSKYYENPYFADEETQAWKKAAQGWTQRWTHVEKATCQGHMAKNGCTET